MSDVHIDTPGQLGQTRSSWRDESHLRGMLLRLMRQHPGATREELETMYLAEMEASKALTQEAGRRCFDNDFRSTQRAVRTPRPIDAGELAAANERLAKVVLLDLLMPNGKKLRDCTGKDCKAAGGWLMLVGLRIGDDGIVGQQLGEAELAAMRASN